MAGRFNLDDYETVEERLGKFWSDHPDGRIVTDLIAYSDEQFIVRAEVWFSDLAPAFTASGYAEERVSTKGVNSTSALENCETSAIGRALANCTYAAKGQRASREEMSKVQRGTAPAMSEEQLTTLLALIAAVPVMEMDTLRETWTENERVLELLPEGAASSLGDAIRARKAELEGVMP